MMMDWFRSHHGAPTDPKWRTIAKRADVAPGVVVSIAWAMLDAASQASDRGSVASVDAETLADFMGYEVETVERVIAAMGDKGVLVDGRFSAWERRQPKKEDDGAAERKRQQRERERLEREETKRREAGQADLPLVPPSHDPSRDVTTEQSREEQSRAEAGRPASAGVPAREPAASQALAEDREFEHAATAALGGGRVKGAFRELLAVEGDRVRIVEVLRAASAGRAQPIGTWKLAATVAREGLASSQAPPGQGARASPPPPISDDGPKVETKLFGRMSVAHLLAEHEAGRWRPGYGPPVGESGCPIAAYLPKTSPEPIPRAAE